MTPPSRFGYWKIWGCRVARQLFECPSQQRSLHFEMESRWRLRCLCFRNSFDCSIEFGGFVRVAKSLDGFEDDTPNQFAVAFQSCGRYLASGFLDETLHIWDINRLSVEELRQWPGGIWFGNSRAIGWLPVILEVVIVFRVLTGRKWSWRRRRNRRS